MWRRKRRWRSRRTVYLLYNCMYAYMCVKASETGVFV